MQKKILLDSTDKVLQFVKASQKAACDVDVVCDRRIFVDAKSIMGVMSCANGSPVILDIHGEEDQVSEYVSQVKDYFVS